MGKILYWECGTGISGDMIVASLLDLGASEDRLRKVLDGIHEGGFEIEISRVSKSGIDCCDFNVVLDAEHENHDHDMAYLYGDKAEIEHHDHEHHHDHDEHEHHHYGHDEHKHGHHHHDEHYDHEHGHEEEHHGDHHHEEHSHDDCCACGSAAHEGHHHHDHEHHHTNLADVTRIIEGLEMTDRAREIALRTFRIVAEAESEAHGLPIDQVHFHEVGAIDSIVDIVAAAVCLDDLDITEVIVPSLAEGTGTVRCQHGVLPVPVPAVLNIAAAHHLPLRIQENRKGELVTPTGAAFVAAVVTSQRLPETFVPVKVGLGAGKRAYEIPSILRAMLIEVPERADAGKDSRAVEQRIDADKSGRAAENTDAVKDAADAECTCVGRDDHAVENVADRDTIIKLECNIDDSTGEQLGYAMERLFEAGARDVHYHPVMMKKNRPAWQLNVITDATHRETIEQVIFKETTTIGIRRMEMERTVLSRRDEMVETPYGEIRVKVCSGGGITRVYPEYESVAAAARERDAAYAEVFRAAERVALAGV